MFFVFLSKGKPVVLNKFNYTKILLIAVTLLLMGNGAQAQQKMKCYGKNNHASCQKIISDSYLYAMLSANAYETNDKIPLPSAKSQVNKPSKKYEDTNIYDNGSFQARVYEITNPMSGDDNTKNLTVVIAYRGTQNLAGGDMFRGSFRKKHRTLAVELYDEIKLKYKSKNPKYILTGHSLGGALALEVAYTHNKDLMDVYVFNTSYHMSKDKRQNTINTKNKIISIEENNDILGWSARVGRKKPLGLSIYKVNYTKFRNHNIKNLAQGLFNEAKNTGNQRAEIIYNLKAEKS